MAIMRRRTPTDIIIISPMNGCGRRVAVLLSTWSVPSVSSCRYSSCIFSQGQIRTGTRPSIPSEETHSLALRFN